MTPKDLAAELAARGLDVTAALVLHWPTECVAEAKDWVTGKRPTVPEFLYAFDYDHKLPTQAEKPAKAAQKQRTMF